MNATTFDIEKANEVENSVMLYFGVKHSVIIGNYDAIEKKVVVFILKKYFDFNQRQLARAYSMNYLFVPTVVQQMEYQIKVDVVFKNKVNQVINSLNYESNQVDQRRRSIA